MEEEWIKILQDGRKVEFTCQGLPKDGAFISAQVEGNEVVYSIVLIQGPSPLSREAVETRFERELSKK